MGRTAVFYGNCQALAISFVAQPALEAAGLTVRRIPSFDSIRDLGPYPTPKDLDAAVVLFEQLDTDGFPYAGALGSDCQRITFPSIDSNVQWPFSALNPYADGGGGFSAAFQGNRVLQRCVDRGWGADQCVRYYLEQYDDFAVDLARLERLNETRTRERNAHADVPVDDLVGDIRAEKRFFSPAHPITPSLLVPRAPALRCSRPFEDRHHGGPFCRVRRRGATIRDTGSSTRSPSARASLVRPIGPISSPRRDGADS